MFFFSGDIFDCFLMPLSVSEFAGSKTYICLYVKKNGINSLVPLTSRGVGRFKALAECPDKNAIFFFFRALYCCISFWGLGCKYYEKHENSRENNYEKLDYIFMSVTTIHILYIIIL